MSGSLEILYEDNHLIAVNKTNHDLVQGDITGDESLDTRIKNYLKEKFDKPGKVFLGVTHRLDRPVSGIVLFARTSKALTRMNEMFRTGNINKIYWAIVKNKPSRTEDTLLHFLVKDIKKNKSFGYTHEVKNSKLAQLSYKLVSSSDKYHLLEINLITGRHHQIRAQLAAIGSPIKGDLKYGYPRSNVNGGISLHARKISFTHPVSKKMIEIVAGTPPDERLWSLFHL